MINECKGCGKDVETGEDINGYCYTCVDNFQKRSPNLGHVWKWNGDVKQCPTCKTYLGMWDGKKPCTPKP